LESDGIHPIKNLLSMNGGFNVVLLRVTCRTKNLQLLHGRYKLDRFLAALFLPESTAKPTVKASKKISLQLPNLTRPDPRTLWCDS
jgi:hypothetical protein